MKDIKARLSAPAPTTHHGSASTEVPTVSQAVPTASMEVATASQAVRTASQAVPTASQAVPTASMEVATASQAVPTASKEVATASQAVPTASTRLPGSGTEFLATPSTDPRPARCALASLSQDGDCTEVLISPDLQQRAVQGDRKALDAILRLAEPRLVNAALLVTTGHQADAWDAVQCVGLRVLTRPSLLGRAAPGRLVGLLCAMTRTAALQGARAERRHRRAVADAAEDTVAPAPCFDPSRKDTLASDLLVRDLLARLPESDRTLVELTMFDGLNTDELSERQGLTRSTTHERLQRSRGRLRRLVAI